MISYRYWLSRFAGSPDVLGQENRGERISADHRRRQPGRTSTAPIQERPPQIRVPVMMKAEMDPVGSGFDYNLKSRRGRWVNVMGRMKPGVTQEQAKASLQPFFHQILEMEVQQKEFARVAPENKQRFLTMWIDTLPASKGDSESAAAIFKRAAGADGHRRTGAADRLRQRRQSY